MKEKQGKQSNDMSTVQAGSRWNKKQRKEKHNPKNRQVNLEILPSKKRRLQN